MRKWAEKRTFTPKATRFMKKYLRNPLVWIAILALAVLVGYRYFQLVFSPNVTTPDGKSYELYVPTGSDYRMVGDQLLRNKLLNNPEAFHWVSERMNYPRNVRPGRYIIENGMSTRELVTLLRSGKQSPIRFTFVKFRTQEQLAEYVDEKFEMTAGQLLEVMQDKEFLNKHNGLTPQTSIAVFIPNTYEVYWNITPRDLFERMYKEYQAFWSDSRNGKREKLGLNRVEVMTLASILEEETNKDDEKARMAGVLMNRIRGRIPLQADPTVKYAVGDFTLTRILFEHLQKDSPYNTYMYPGIPPGPICTPSIPSIEAVLNCEKHSYIFYCAKIDGSGYHHFSQTLAEHNQYAAQYHSMLDK